MNAYWKSATTYLMLKSQTYFLTIELRERLLAYKYSLSKAK